MKRFTAVLGASCLVLALLSCCASATQIEYRSPRDLGRESSLIVRGKVAAVRSFWNDAGTKVFTETTVSVEEAYKGSQAGTISVLQLGGVVGNVRVSQEESS